MIAGHKGEVPFFVLIVPFLAGILLGVFFGQPGLIPFLWILLAAITAAFVSLNLFYRKLKLYKARWTGGLLMHLVLLVLGWLVAVKYNELNDKNHFARISSQYLIVKINSEPIAKGGLIRFTSDVEKSVTGSRTGEVSGNLLVTIRDSAAGSLYYGDELLIPAKYDAVAPPANPAEFNYKKYLANQNIHYQAFLQRGQFVVLKANTGNPVIAYALRLRQRLVEKFKTSMHNTEAIGVASTLILGYKADLSNDVLQAYSKTGTIHVLSVSGAHVAIIFYLLNLVLGFTDRFRHGKVVKAVLVIVLIWAYSLLTGFSPAVCRAAFMISMIIIGKTYNRHINSLNVLAISAFFLLLYDPFFILDVGFQLSYLAVGGLIVFQPIVYKWFDFQNKWADKLWILCSASIAAQVITFPLSAYYFHQFPVYFLVSNLLIIIPSMVILYAGMAYLLLPAIPFLSAALAWTLEKSILAMDSALGFIEHAPFAGISKIWISTWDCLLLYGIIIGVLYFFYNRKTALLRFNLAMMLLFTVSVSIKRWNTLSTSNITFLSLKKHTGIVFKTGDKAVVLTDLTDTDKAYRYSVQPYLDSCQVASVRCFLPDDDIRLPGLHKKAGLAQFGDKRILLLNTSIPDLAPGQKIATDCLYVSGTREPDTALIGKNYQCKLFIIDVNNSPQAVHLLEQQASSKHIEYWEPGRNKSVLPVSN
ncbi:MAG TPA: ComEC/Rec2 family competence protein [Mucilaginibacter sp.]|nr:ComEC/Rec2 family competence protein [Mucilaginibacter sp.]